MPLILMHPRHPLRLLILALLALPCLPGNAAEAAASRPPNLLLILIDDTGWKDMGCSGSRYQETPHIDRLASRGMRFTNAYSAGIVCNPSRGAIHSGKFPARTKLTPPLIGPDGPDDRLHPISKYQGQNHPNLEARHRRVLPKDQVIFAQALAEGGYRTGKASTSGSPKTSPTRSAASLRNVSKRPHKNDPNPLTMS